MTDLSLAATLFGPEDLRVVEKDLGALAPGMVRVRFGAGGICGSDMHYFRHARTGDFVVTSPLILGHEVSGEVVELGEGVGGLEVGDRVAVNPSRWCGALPRAAARAGRTCARTSTSWAPPRRRRICKAASRACSTPFPRNA